MTPDPAFTLWFRPDRSRPWEAVFAGPTHFDCVLAIGTAVVRPNGDWLILAGTARPANVNLTWARKKEPTA